MKGLRYIGVLTAVLVLIGSLSGCSKKSRTDEIRIGYFPNITHSQALIMKNQKTLEDKLGEDYTVTWTQFNAGPAEVEAIFAGEIDLGYIGPVPAVNAYVKSDGDVKIIGGAANGGAVLVVRKDIVLTDISGLSGLKIAIPQLANTQHLSLLNLLEENGLSTTAKGGTVEVVAAENADIVTLMEKGELDGALVPEPWGSILESGSNGTVFLDYKDIWMDGNYATAVIVARKEFLEEHPEEVKAFLDIHKQTTEFINSDLESAGTIVNKELESATGKALEQSILDSAFSRIIFSWEIPEDSILKFAEISKELGYSQEVPGQDVFYDSLLEE